MGKHELERLVDRRNHSHQRLLNLLQYVGLANQTLQISSIGPDRISGRTISNFVHSDYLGLSRHPYIIRSACRGAKQAGISVGMPRILAHDQRSDFLEIALARLVNQEKSTIYSSTVQIALDALPLLAGDHGVILMDTWAYPISLEGAHAAIRRGAKKIAFAHNDPTALETALRSIRHIRDKVIVCDGVYSAGGSKAPLKEYSSLAERYGAVIYVDDAHGLGILGMDPQKYPPYGHGGGGTPLFEGVVPGNILYIASLSKALGVPLAFIAGPKKAIDYIRRESQSFIHNSQPALPMLAAAIGALRVNETEGDQLRKQLAERVKQFIMGFNQMGIHIPDNRCFPIQSLYFQSLGDAWQTGLKLRRNGIWPLLQISPIDFPTGGVLRFVITAKHSTTDIQHVHKLIRPCARSIVGADH